jgi:two-component system, cell cycle response regulator DivK
MAIPTLLVEATDGQAGVAQALAHRPDLILMDIALPVLDDIQALAAIRAEAAPRLTPFIALTASAMNGDREEIPSCGFDGYLAKPIDETQLIQILWEVLDDN